MIESSFRYWTTRCVTFMIVGTIATNIYEERPDQGLFYKGRLRSNNAGSLVLLGDLSTILVAKECRGS